MRLLMELSPRRARARSLIKRHPGAAEQWVGDSAQGTDHRADAAAFNQPAARTWLPCATGPPEHGVKHARRPNGDQPAQFAEFSRADMTGEGCRTHRVESESCRVRRRAYFARGACAAARHGRRGTADARSPALCFTLRRVGSVAGEELASVATNVRNSDPAQFGVLLLDRDGRCGGSGGAPAGGNGIEAGGTRRARRDRWSQDRKAMADRRLATAKNHWRSP